MPKFQIPEMITDALRSKKEEYPSSRLYEYKNRFSLLGTVGAGKSTVAGLVVLTTQTLSSARPEFICRILERNSNIYGDVSNLRSGKFPEKTVAHDSFATEAGLLLTQKKFLGAKKIQIPICDVAGEDIQIMIQQYRKVAGPLGTAAYSAANSLVRYIKESEGFIVAVDASRAVIGRRGEQVQSETDKQIHPDPDVNLVRILNEVFDYKEQVRKPIKGIAIVITKWDELKPHVEHLGMNIMEPTRHDLMVFMDTFFPSVSQAIKSYQFAHPSVDIAYFPTYVEIERDDKGNPKKRDDGSFKIKPKESMLIADVRKPSYSEQTCAELIDWLLGFAS